MIAPEAIAKVIVEHNCMYIAELGVNSCNFCDQLLGILKGKGHQLLEYYLIDPWPHGYKCGSCGGDKTTDEKWDSLYRAAVKRTIGNDFLKVMRLTSVEAAKLFPDNYLDLFFIDADHTYKSMMEDIPAWMPKLAKWGVASGHDYSGGWQPVVDAVDEYFIERAGKAGELKKFYEIDDKHYRMDSGVWVVEL